MQPIEQLVKTIHISKMMEIEESGNIEWQVYLAAIEYINNGLYVLPLAKNSKKLPSSNTGINYGSASKSPAVIERWFHPTEGRFAGHNIGLATGKEDGIFVVDVDRHGADDGLVNLRKLEKAHGKMPEGPMQDTPGGGQHYVFMWQSNAASSTNKIAKSIDTRGGTENACKGHIVAFPSEIDGKKYRWASGGDIPFVPRWVMEKLGTVWRLPSKGGRGNENVQDDDIEQKVPLDQIKRMLAAIDPDDLDYEQWLRVGLAIKSQYPGNDGLDLWDSWSKGGIRYEPKECVTRWEGFADSGTVRMGTLFYYAMESGWAPDKEQGDVVNPNKYDVIVERLNQTYAIVAVGGKIRILREKETGGDPLLTPYDLLNKDDFRTLLQNDTTVIDGKNGPKVVSVADIWLAHEGRRTYPNGTGLFPDGAPEGWYNTWTGLAIAPRRGECSLFLDHVKNVICAGRDDYFEWLMDWCADAVQDPANPKGTAVVMRGEEGCGKGTLANTMGEFFGSHYRHLIDDTHLTSNFNAHMMDALFVFADEITWGGNKKTDGKLKGMVTERHLLGERKGIDAVGYRNMIHVMIASNGDWVIPAGTNSRRWFMLDIPDTKVGDKRYFDAIIDELENGGREALLYWLLDRKVTHNLRKAPDTKFLREQRQRTLVSNSFAQWWIDRINRGYIDITEEKEFDPNNAAGSSWPDVVKKVDLYDDYAEWCNNQRAQALSMNVFFMEAKKYGMVQSRPRINGNRVYAVRIPPIEECIDTLRNMGVWVDDEDE